MDTKKNKERTIFDLVYKGRAFDSVTPSEEPDFRIKNADCEFGVEVTEFYFSQSKARMRNIPGYVKDIIEGKKYRHKDDVLHLEVKEFMVQPGDNRRPNFKIEAIMQRLPSITEYVQKISELIEHKNKLFGNYIAGLHHVNLIIYDDERRLLGTPTDKFHYMFFHSELEQAVMKTDFREIFFVTKLGEFDSPKDVYIPLKMLFLLAEIFSLNYILVNEYADPPMTPLLSAEYLLWRGARDIHVKETSDNFEIVYGNSGIVISKNEHVHVIDYDDSVVPEGYTPVTPVQVSSFFDDAFLAAFEKHKSNYVFSCGLCFDVSGSNFLASDE